MLKKILIASAIVAFTSTAFATQGPYVGLGASIENVHSYTGLLGNAFVGYGLMAGATENGYLGFELFMQAGSIALSNNQNNRLTYGYGLSFLPGFYFNPYSMLFARIGLRATQLHKTNNTHTGVQVGLGLQTSFTENWDVRGEYDYTGSGIIQNFGKLRANDWTIDVIYKFC